MSSTVNVVFTPVRASGSVPVGVTVLEAARLLGIGIEGPCNGAGKCRKDLVQLRRDGRLDTVLACKAVLREDTEVIIPSHHTGSIKAVDDYFGAGTAPLPLDPPALNIAKDAETSTQNFGIALDIGTTTIAASITDLTNGRPAGRASTLNPLVYYGHDVMSRIKHSVSSEDGLLRMHRELVSAVNLLVDVLTTDSGIDRDDIHHLVAAGNTTMQHIFLNLEIRGIGEYPYTAQTLDRYSTTARQLGIGILESAVVEVFPCMSAYVGGDIVSGLMAIGAANGHRTALFIDVGTNGEMVLLTGNSMVATSTAAGPCFEGMTISCGMRAETGAIERVAFDDGVSIEVIGGGAPRGICGSGLMDAVSEMIRVGLINARGRLQAADSPAIPESWRERLFDKDGKRHFRLAEGVAISQEDIRQVQLARAAIRSGVELLLSESGVGHDQLSHIVIAGGFGYHLSRESLLTVGLVPDFPNARISFVGNSSLEGARLGLLSRGVMDAAATVAKGAGVLELSHVEGFEKRFVREMGFA